MFLRGELDHFYIDKPFQGKGYGKQFLDWITLDQITNLFKDGFARLRPCHDPDIAPLMRLVKDRCGGLYGFFSGHSSNSFALAIFFITFFKSIYPVMRWLVLWAAIVAYSRVYVGVHYPIDILCGALFGSVIGLVFARASRRYLLP